MTTVPRTPPPVPAPAVRRWLWPWSRPASKPVRFGCGRCGLELASVAALLEHREASCGKGERG